MKKFNARSLSLSRSPFSQAIRDHCTGFAGFLTLYSPLQTFLALYYSLDGSEIHLSLAVQTGPSSWFLSNVSNLVHPQTPFSLSSHFPVN